MQRARKLFAVNDIGPLAALLLHHYDQRSFADLKRSFNTVCKPNPDIIFYACEELGVKPVNMVFVEDSVSGVIAGKAAGCYVVALTSTTSEERLRTAGADMVISNLLELKHIISELYMMKG